MQKSIFHILKFPYVTFISFLNLAEYRGKLFQFWLNKDVNKYLKSLLSLALFLVITSSISGQAAGDYRTVISGNWSNNALWEVYDGALWNACGLGNYPGAAAGTLTVNIRNSHTVTMDVTPANNIGALTFANGTALLTVLDVNGQTLNVTGAVTFGVPAADPGDHPFPGKL